MTIDFFVSKNSEEYFLRMFFGKFEFVEMTGKFVFCLSIVCVWLSNAKLGF